MRATPCPRLACALNRNTRHRTCAVVGNAGHLRLQKYGEFIDAHDVVVRFNAQSVKGWVPEASKLTAERKQDKAPRARVQFVVPPQIKIKCACTSGALQSVSQYLFETRASGALHPSLKS